jgi:hypothetical protein
VKVKVVFNTHMQPTSHQHGESCGEVWVPQTLTGTNISKLMYQGTR